MELNHFIISSLSAALVNLLTAFFSHYYLQRLLKKKNKKLYLRSDTNFESCWDWPIEAMHWFIEKIILLKVDGYKNNPRGNFIWLRSIVQITLLYFIVFNLLSLTIDKNFFMDYLKNPMNGTGIVALVGVYLGLIGTLYWNETNRHKDKWTYLSNLYNEILKSHNDKSKVSILSNTLAIDAITLTMWNHRSFQYLVLIELNEAIDAVSDKKKRVEIRKKLRSKKLKESEAIDLLSDYQQILFNRYCPS